MLFSLVRGMLGAYGGTHPENLNHTLGHVDCPACEWSRSQVLHGPNPSGSAPFSVVAEAWLESKRFHGPRGRYVAPRTLHDYEVYIKTLNRFFGSLKPSEIHIGHLRTYEHHRSDGTLGHASPNKIISEIGILKQVMRRADCWTAVLDEAYHPLQRTELDIPRALSPKEQQTWLDVASSRPEWQLAYWYSLIAFRTTMRACEMRGIRRGDVNIPSRVISVRSDFAKNRHAIRTIPLASDAQWALERCLELSWSRGSKEPHHFLFPFGIRGGWSYDPTRPMSVTGIRKPWEAIRDAAGLPWFRVYDTRHTAITRLAEAGVALAVIKSMAGHISSRMSEHYTAVSEQAKREAIELAVHAQSFKRRPMSAYQRQA